MVEKAPERERTKFKQFMWDHGKTVANAQSLARLPLTFVVRRNIKKGRLGRAFVAYGVSAALDKGDGWAARMSKIGPTDLGGRMDDLADKFSSIGTEHALVQSNMMDTFDFVARTGREGVMTLYERPKYKKKGISTSAIRATKWSTAGTIIANGLSMTRYVQERPILRKIIQRTATGGKIVSLALSPRGWAKRHEAKLRYESLSAKGSVYKAVIPARADL